MSSPKSFASLHCFSSFASLPANSFFNVFNTLLPRFKRWKARVETFEHGLYGGAKLDEHLFQPTGTCQVKDLKWSPQSSTKTWSRTNRGIHVCCRCDPLTHNRDRFSQQSHLESVCYVSTSLFLKNNRSLTQFQHKFLIQVTVSSEVCSPLTIFTKGIMWGELNGCEITHLSGLSVTFCISVIRRPDELLDKIASGRAIVKGTNNGTN